MDENVETTNGLSISELKGKIFKKMSLSAPEEINIQEMKEEIFALCIAYDKEMEDQNKLMKYMFDKLTKTEERLDEIEKELGRFSTESLKAFQTEGFFARLKNRIKRFFGKI